MWKEEKKKRATHTTILYEALITSISTLTTNDASTFVCVYMYNVVKSTFLDGTLPSLGDSSKTQAQTATCCELRSSVKWKKDSQNLEGTWRTSWATWLRIRGLNTEELDYWTIDMWLIENTLQLWEEADQ